MKNTTALAVHPEYKMYQKNNTAYCSSLQVAEAFGKQHFHVLRDIEALGQSKIGESSEAGQLTSGESSEAGVPKSGEIEAALSDFFKDNFIRTTYINSQNKKQPMYLMTEEGFTLLTMGYTGLKAMYLKIQYIKQFKAMKAFIRDYILGKEEFPIFTQAIADTYENPQPYHYSNEMNMIYRIVLGMDAKTFREAHGLEHGESIRPFLSEAQQKTIRKLQTEDIRLLYKGAGYNDRKNALTVKALTAKALPAKI